MRFLSRLLLVSSILPVIMFLKWDVVEAIDYKTLTVSETREVFGDSLTVRYFNGSEYVETEAVLNQQTTFPRRVFSPSGYSGDPAIFDLQTMWLRYDFSGPVNTNPSYIQVDFTIESTFKTSRFLTCLAVRNNTYMTIADNNLSSVYSLPTWDIYDNGSRTQFFGSENDSYIYAVDFGSSSSHAWASFIPVDISTVDSHTYVTGRACFYGVSGQSIFIRCPMIDFDGTAENGDTSGGDSGGGSSVDLSETNGLLGTINGWLSSIAGLISNISDTVVDGVKGLFVPNDGFIDTWQGTISTMFSDHFGGIVEAFHIAEDVFSEFDDVVASETIHFDGISWDSGQGVFKIPEADIPLKPASDKLGALYVALATIIDIICTVAFINMLRRRAERFLGGGNDI